MPLETVSKITPAEMFEIWPDIWRNDAAELSDTLTDVDPITIGHVALLSADEPTLQHAKLSEQRRGKHRLRHIELGPLKVHRVALPLAAIAAGVAFAYFSPHEESPAIAKEPQATSTPSPRTSHTTQAPQRSHQPTTPYASPSTIDPGLIGYPISPSSRPSYKYHWSSQPTPRSTMPVGSPSSESTPSTPSSSTAPSYEPSTSPAAPTTTPPETAQPSEEPTTSAVPTAPSAVPSSEVPFSSQPATTPPATSETTTQQPHPSSPMSDYSAQETYGGWQ